MTAFGAITLGSKVAFNDLAGSFIILSTISYLLCFLPNLLTSRKYVPVGPFHLGRAGPYVHALASVLIIFFNIIFCLPYGLPVSPQLMNYNSVILVGLAAVTAGWWFVGARSVYKGPVLPKMDAAGRVIAQDPDR